MVRSGVGDPLVWCWRSLKVVAMWRCGRKPRRETKVALIARMGGWEGKRFDWLCHSRFGRHFIGNVQMSVTYLIDVYLDDTGALMPVLMAWL